MTSTILRWSIGIPLALASGTGTILIPLYQFQLGWDRDTSLVGVIYAWVFVGSLLFLGRREAGRRILRGASIAFAVFFTVVVLTPPYETVIPLTYSMWTILGAALVGAILSLRSVRMAMRENGGVG